MPRYSLWLLVPLAFAGCATVHDGGWQGRDAEPFDGAHEACIAEVADLPHGAERDSAFEACMERRGWRRP